MIVRKATVFFKADERGVAYDALSALGVTRVQGQGYTFDNVEYGESKWVTLTRGLVAYVVPARSVLLIKVDVEDGRTTS